MSEIFLQQLWPWFPRSNSHRHAQQESKLWLTKIKRRDKLKNVNCIYIDKTSSQTPIKISLGTHLEPDGMLMFPLHVIYMPCHSLHGIYGIQHHIIALSVLVKVVFYFLRQKEKNQSPLIPTWTFLAKRNTVFICTVLSAHNHHLKATFLPLPLMHVAINLINTRWCTKSSLWGQFSSKHTCSSQCEQRGTERECSADRRLFRQHLMAFLQHRTFLHTYKILMELHQALLYSWRAEKHQAF